MSLPCTGVSKHEAGDGGDGGGCGSSCERVLLRLSLRFYSTFRDMPLRPFARDASSRSRDVTTHSQNRPGSVRRLF